MYRLRFNILVLVVWIAAVVGASFQKDITRYWDMMGAAVVAALIIVIVGRFSLGPLTLPILFVAYSSLLISAPLLTFIPEAYRSYPDPITAIVKLLILTTTIVLTQRLVYEMVDFEDSVTGLSLDLAGLSPRIFNYELDEVYREVRRARRFDQSLTLAVVRPDYSHPDIKVNRISAELLERLKNRYLQIKLMERWSIDLNDSDIVVREGNEFILAFPNTSPEKVEKMLQDYEGYTAEWGLPLEFGVSSMPDEAVTYAKLIEQARMNLINDEPEQPNMPQQLEPEFAHK